MLILKAIDQYQGNRKRRAREKAEWEAASREQGIEQGMEQGIAEGMEQGIAQGLEQGRAQATAAIRALLIERGINLDDLPPLAEAYPSQNGNAAAANILANLQLRRGE